MKRLLTVLAFLAVFPGVAGAAGPRFLPLDVHLDTPVPVAAWQFELKDANGAMTVVGVENGGHPAYSRAPYYDREALAQGGAPRIVVADYSLAEADRLPSGRVRLATLHLMLDGNPDFDLRLIAAAGPDGGALDASISLAARTNNLQETSR